MLSAGDEDLTHSQQHPELYADEDLLDYPCPACDAPAGQACSPARDAR